MSNINPKSPYERPGTETGYESASRRGGLRDRSTGPSMLVILLAVAAILVIGFLVFGRWNNSGNVAQIGGGDTSTSTGTTSGSGSSATGTTTGSGSGTTTTAPAVPPAGSTDTTPPAAPNPAVPAPVTPPATPQ